MSSPAFQIVRRAAFLAMWFVVGIGLQIAFFTARHSSEAAVWAFTLLGSPFMVVAAFLAAVFHVDLGEELNFLAEMVTGGLLFVMVGLLVHRYRPGAPSE